MHDISVSPRPAANSVREAIAFWNRTFADLGTPFVRHEVSDFAAWKKAYDGFRATQKKMGVVAQAVYRSVDDPNDVTVTHEFHSLERAKAFAASPELKSAMEKSGVKGAPQIWYTTKGAK